MRISSWIVIEEQGDSDTYLIYLQPDHPDFTEGLVVGGDIIEGSDAALYVANAYTSLLMQMVVDWHEELRADPEFEYVEKEWVHKYSNVPKDALGFVDYLRFIPDFLDLNVAESLGLPHGISLGAPEQFAPDDFSGINMYKSKCLEYIKNIEDKILKPDYLFV